MKRSHDLSALPWQLAGFTPHQWRLQRSLEIGASAAAEVGPVPARVPGSVQRALREADLLPDWNLGLDARLCEWVEHRHWIFETQLPAEWLAELPPAASVRLACLGLDYQGCVRLDGIEAGAFRGSFVPHTFELTPLVAAGTQRLQIVFEGHPGWLGQFGYTSRMTEWKPRFNYTWDWTSRLVQIGIWDELALVVSDGEELAELSLQPTVDAAHGRGALALQARVRGAAGRTVRLSLAREGQLLQAREVGRAELEAGLRWADLPVELWWPSGSGRQPLYELRCELLDGAGRALDELRRTIGFKELAWRACAGAPAGAEPWLCAVNGQPVFLQGVNWTPIRPNFADVTQDEVDRRLALYQQLGVNLLRVWGGAVLEREGFYRRCDELGLLVWQELPLSSSGVDNWPPEEPAAIAELAAIAESYVARRQHHASLAVWCGGNELQGSLDGGKSGGGKPVDAAHPLLARLAQVVRERDPQRRFLPTSASGPRFTAAEEDFGQGLHWDVHGPWNVSGPTLDGWQRYWDGDDALFRSETGCPGASPAELIRRYAGDCDAMPARNSNPLWRRTAWWTEADAFRAAHGREPLSLEEYVAWSQARQRDALALAAARCKARFPAIGGLIVWMGHDCFPCTANTSIVDFEGRPKPAALALGEIFRAAQPARRG